VLESTGGISMVKENSEGIKVQRILFLALFAALFAMIAVLVKPFFSILLWASVVYGLTQPLYRRVATGKGGQPRGRKARSLLAAGFAMGSLVLIVLPVALLSLAMIGQLKELFRVAMDLLAQVERFFRGDGAARMAARLSEISGGAIDAGGVDLAGQASSLLGGYAERIISLSAGAIRNVAGLALQLAFFAFALFFLYVDGKELMLMLMDAIPLRNAYTVSLMRKFRDTGRDLVIGYALMAAFQGVMAFIVFSVMSVPAPIPLALMCAVASIVPIAGASIVWFPVVLLRLATGPLAQAVLLFALCAVLISSLDNFVRPLLLHSRIKLHPLLIFISIIGGIEAFGVNGLILGPILIVMFFSSVDIFGKLYGKARRRAPDDEDGGLPE